ncbi:MAG: zinc dependent phospholipase C family protein [Desulfosalsimonadaceae bacterium]
MPGTYTHLTITSLLTGGNEMDALGLPKKAQNALRKFSDFCDMGAISPDYPYLKISGIGKQAAQDWANAMHHKYGTYTKKNILHVCIDYLKGLSGNEQDKCFAWSLGYASHVTADVTCHPVTNLLVGDYEANNQKDHRESEMHQDVYIYKKKLKRDLRAAEHIKNVVGSCIDLDSEKIAPEINSIWTHMLSEAFPDLYRKYKKINIDNWHGWVQFLVDGCAEEFPYFPTRHIFGEGLVYPSIEAIDEDRFINNLKTPNGIMKYDDVFEKALDNVSKVWKIISDAVFADDNAYLEKINIWNLDTGQDIRTPKVMWEGQI